jgi:DeoR/GlpR family transcriptional regulator of sugar metabolism
VRSVERWNFDAAFLSAEGMDAEGLWNSQLEVVAHQHAVVRRARHNVFLLDRTKLGKRAAHFLLPWAAVDHLVSDAGRERVAGLASGALRAMWELGAPPPLRRETPGVAGELPVHFL